MLKKFLAIILTLLIMNISLLPALAISDNLPRKVSMSYTTDINLKNSSIGQIVEFKLNEDLKDADGNLIPAGSVFHGQVVHLKKNKIFYRRAKAKIALERVTFPDGQTYTLQHKVNKKLIGHFAPNVIKGIIGTPFAIVVWCTGGVVMFVESITIVGFILVPATSDGFAHLGGAAIKGINYKAKPGKKIKIKFNENFRINKVKD